MDQLFLLSCIVTVLPVFVYLIYIIVAFTSRPKKIKHLESLPNVSIVIPAYNEELVLPDHIDNLAEIYPKDKMEIIISNDGSTDNTEKVSLEALERNSINGKVITNPRSGANKAINRGIEEASSDIIVITGADGRFDKDTIPDLVSVLLSRDDIGAVSGDIVPLSKGDTLFSKSESAYRSIYGKIGVWESNIHSTYCLNGAVVAFKRSASPSLHARKGADDASRALSIIRNGYKCKYVPSARFYEYVPFEFKEQKKQKIRRATRLMEATFMNLDMFSPKYGKFGTVVFPLRVLMFFVVPSMFFLSIILWAIYFASISLLYAVGFLGLIAIVVLSGRLKPNMFSSFFIYQGYLLFGLLNLRKDVHIWEPNKRENS
ncbi:MAG: glycosyltransferase [Methanosarcina sp.]|uniref:glycosyltransferase n=1 Tax=Methanosarcina sp. TaxID=2213 RepID=UPI00261F74F6|nr:glycosyltransferase [Methanosarcina sp.]MDD3246153.1 glycosyltransferase [Methanosarcina sp.]MDD4249029.1 glycosyltransferase [Methanosarcina sp.]